MNIIERNIDSLISLCKQHKVKELYTFGSILTPNFNKDSDIDLLVQFDNVDILQYADNYFDFKEKLEALLGRDVDLLENQAIRNPIFRKILDRDKKIVMTEKQLKLLYDVKLAIDEIESYFDTEAKIYENYKSNSILKRAIERNLEIIGEAKQRLRH